MLAFSLASFAQSRRTPRPSPLVQPPDLLEEEDPAPKKDAPKPKPDPIPQIRRKKENVDERFRQGTYYIEHPNSAKGLYLIDKNKDYFYRVKPSDQREVSSLLIGTYEPTKLGSGAYTFNDLYDETDFPMVYYSYDRELFRGFGRLSWEIGAGLYIAQGHGRFEDNRDEPPKEKFTLFVMPLSFGATYRLKFFDYQWIIPFGEGGIDLFAFGENRDDDQNPTLGAALGAALASHFSAGVSLALGKDARSFLELDREYGINSIFLTAVYRAYVGLSDKYDFTGDFISGGLTMEY